MAQTNVSIRMDEDLKKQFDIFCSDIGMNMTTAINVFVKTAVREQRIPFEVSAVPNADTITAIENVRKGIGMSKAFNSVTELMEDLNAED